MSHVESDQVKNPDGLTDEAAHIFLEGSWKYFILAPLERLGKHVLSFWTKGKTSGDMTINYADEQINIPITTEWQRVVFKFKAQSITNIWIYFSGYEYWMYNTQLQTGDIATDYNKNPDEIEDKLGNEIADIKEKVEQYRKETYAEILVTKESITQSVSASITETKKYADTVANNAKKESIEETTVEFQTQISQTQSSILQTVSATYATNGTVDQVKSSVASVEITANKINWLVKSGTSSSNFELTDRAATLVANYINLKGLVQFSGLDSSTQSTISKVSSWSSSSNTTLIDGGKIYTGTITADKIKIDSLQAISAKIGGFTIGSSYIANGTTYLGGGYNSVYLGTNGISCGNKFKVTNSGEITAKGGTIGGFAIGEKYIANGTTSLGGGSTSVYLGTNGISCGSKFKVTNSGTLTCSDVTATGGKIGGFTISNNALYSGKSSMSSTATGIYVGTDGISIGSYGTPALKVTSSGELSIGYNGTIKFTSGMYNMELTSSKLTFEGGNSTTTLKSNQISLGFIDIEGTRIQCGENSGYTKIENNKVTLHSSSYDTVVTPSKILIESPIDNAFEVYGTSTFRKGITVGQGTNSAKIQLGTNKNYTNIGFFGKSATTQRSVAKMSTSGTPTASTLRSKINELITALQGYGLIG